jgi:putative membrane protein
MNASSRAFMRPEELEQIASCVREAERASRGEIAVLIAPASHDYPVADLLGAAGLSVPAAVVLTRVLGDLIWAGPHDLWVFLGLLFPLFLLCRAAVARLPRLKRLFVPRAEMDREVREAAKVQFFERGLHRTAEENGVLLYLSVFEGRVWVLGDRGVDAAVSSGFWQEIADQVAAGMKDGRRAAAVCAAVARIRGVLAEKFPAAPGDRDELPDLIIDA